MTFFYLWKNREIAPFLSNRFSKLWAKRIYHLNSLVCLIVNRIILSKKGVEIGDKSIVFNFNLVGRRRYLSIGNNCLITKTVHMACHEKIIIGNNVVINDHVKLLTATHDLVDATWPMIMKPIVIGNYAWIATSAIILPGVTIGDGAVVGAGAVISKDVPPYGIVFGNPSQLSSKRRNENLSYNPALSVSCVEAWLGKNTNNCN